MILTDAILDRIDIIAALATPGPWVVCEACGGQCVCGLVWSDPWDMAVSAGTLYGPTRMEDARFIATANPLVVRELIAEVRLLRRVFLKDGDDVRIG